MCGLVALFSNDKIETPENAVRAALARMRARGPDAEGIWSGDGVVLGHRRLAILDLDARANQPMLSVDGRYAIVFNGEIYNFRELRRELEAEGAVFQTSSDTEVVLTLFAREGEAMLPRLRGMFAFVIWDRVSRCAFAARDPYGIKPLYYAQTKQGLAFASQVKALLASGLVEQDCEPAGLAGFYLWGSVPEPWTLYRGILALPAGHSLHVREGRAGAPVCWDDIRTRWQADARVAPIAELQAIVRQAMTDSVRAHLVSDVPVSVFLSGGVDSGVIAGLAAQLGAPVEGITIGFDEFAGRPDDEIPLARVLAGHYGLRHQVRRVSGEEFEREMPRILDAMDQPSVDGINTWFASKAAAERGYKVVLSGVGGDELFHGYSLFDQLPRQAATGRALASIPGVRSLMTWPCACVARMRAQPKLRGVPDFMGSLAGMYFLRRCLFLPDELPGLMGADRAHEGLARLGGKPPGMSAELASDAGNEVGLLESTHYLRNQLLRDSDWASMDHSLELRTPLVDARLLDTLSPYLPAFAGGVGKALLAGAPQKALPAEVVNRPKTGFSLPMTVWLSDPSGILADRRLAPPGMARAHWSRRWACAILAKAESCG